MSKREQQNAYLGRNESQHLNVQASTGRIAVKKEDEERDKCFLNGRQAHSELGGEGGRKLQENLRNLDLTNFAVNTATW